MSIYRKISDFGIGATQRMKIFWVANGEIDAAIIHIYHFNDQPESIEKILGDHGIVCEYLPQSVEKNEVARICIAKTEKRLRQFKTAFNDERTHIVLKMSGWPISSIEAFTDPAKQLEKEYYPLFMIHHPLQFTLSKDHAGDEVEIFRSRMKMVKKFCPKIYAEMPQHMLPFVK